MLNPINSSDVVSHCRGRLAANHCDVDLADPAWNTSGQPWSTLYFKGNYPRLQQIKARYDPADVFRHPLSVQLPSHHP